MSGHLSWIGIEARVIDACDAAGYEVHPNVSARSADNIVSGLRRAGVPVTDNKPGDPVAGEIFRVAS
jgi:hypothetical protein